jgi:hypothetical protein
MGDQRHFESYAEQQIREAMARGEFDDLPGAGKPLAGASAPYDPEWWAKGFIVREQARSRADEVRRLIRRELPRLKVSRDRDAAMARVAEINRMVDAVNQHLPHPDRIAPVEI